MALKSKALRTIDDLTPKQRNFVDIIVLTGVRLQRARPAKEQVMKLRVIKIFLILVVDLHKEDIIHTW